MDTENGTRVLKTREKRYGVSTVREKIFYSLGDVGSSFIWYFTSSFLTLYYTDSVGLSAAYVGTMMLISRLLDGASDITMGIVIEKTRTRWGKARPWVLFGSIPISLALVLLFNVPSEFSQNAKNVYVFITYCFLTVICYTVVNLAYHAMLPRFSLDQQDRAVVSTVRGLFTLVISLVLSIMTPALLNTFGGDKDQGAWTTISIIYAVMALVCLLACFFGVKERNLERTAEDKPIEKVPIKKALGIVLTNKYFYIAASIFILFYITNGSAGGAIYYARDVLGDASYYGIMSMAGMLPMLAVMPLTPLLFKKFGKRTTIMAGFVLGIVGSAVQLTNPYSLPFVLGCTAVRSTGLVPLTTALFTFAGDIVDYDDWKNGVRTEGLVTAVNSFGMKVGTGLGSALLGWLLAAGKYDAAAAEQPQSALNAMIGVTVGIPLTVCVLSFILMLFWDIDRHRPEIDRYLEQKQGHDA